MELFNYIDIAIIAILIIFVLAGYHGGFIVSGLNLVAFFLSLLIAFTFYTSLSGWMLKNDYIFPEMRYYVEGSDKISIEDSKRNVNMLDEEQVNAIVYNSDDELTVPLPMHIEDIIADNLNKKVFSDRTDMDIYTVGDYYNETLVIFVINMISFFIVFILSRTLLAFVIHGVNYVVHFPVLKQFDSLLGCAFGLIRGIFVIFVVFMIVPAVIAMLPEDWISGIINESNFGDMFYSSNFLTSLIKGVL